LIISLAVVVAVRVARVVKMEGVVVVGMVIVVVVVVGVVEIEVVGDVVEEIVPTTALVVKTSWCLGNWAALLSPTVVAKNSVGQME